MPSGGEGQVLSQHEIIGNLGLGMHEAPMTVDVYQVLSKLKSTSSRKVSISVTQLTVSVFMF